MRGGYGEKIGIGVAKMMEIELWHIGYRSTRTDDK
jgi:hypothetical protein